MLVCHKENTVPEMTEMGKADRTNGSKFLELDSIFISTNVPEEENVINNNSAKILFTLALSPRGFGSIRNCV